MPNTLTESNGVLSIDTADQAVKLPPSMSGMKGVLIRASADNWVVTLQDGNGNVIFDAASNIVGSRGGPVPLPGVVPVPAILASTLTNITRVIVYIGSPI